MKREFGMSVSIIEEVCMNSVHSSSQLGSLERDVAAKRMSGKSADVERTKSCGREPRCKINNKVVPEIHACDLAGIR